MARQQLCSQEEGATSTLSKADVDRSESVHFWEEKEGGKQSSLAESCPRAVPKGTADGCLRGGGVQRKGAVIAES